MDTCVDVHGRELSSWDSNTCVARLIDAPPINQSAFDPSRSCMPAYVEWGIQNLCCAHSSWYVSAYVGICSCHPLACAATRGGQLISSHDGTCVATECIDSPFSHTAHEYGLWNGGAMSGVWGEGGIGRDGVNESDAARREVVAERSSIHRSTAAAGARGHVPQGNAGSACHIVCVYVCRFACCRKSEARFGWFCASD